MFRKILLIAIAILFLHGCATHSRNTVGGMHNDLATGLRVYHQYQKVTEHHKKGKLYHYSTAFLADESRDLPDNLVGLSIDMTFINPFKQRFEVWENTCFKDLQTNKTYLKTKKLRYTSQLLPEEVISLNMPLNSDSNIYSQVIFSVPL